MKLRLKERPEQLCASSKFNTSTVGEILVIFLPDGERDSDYIINYDVYLEAIGDWKDMAQAFRDHDLIIDNYNTRFFEPRTDEDKQRGFTL